MSALKNIVDEIHALVAQRMAVVILEENEMNLTEKNLGAENDQLREEVRRMRRSFDICFKENWRLRVDREELKQELENKSKDEVRETVDETIKVLERSKPKEPLFEASNFEDTIDKYPFANVDLSYLAKLISEDANRLVTPIVADRDGWQRACIQTLEENEELKQQLDFTTRQWKFEQNERKRYREENERLRQRLMDFKCGPTDVETQLIKENERLRNEIERLQQENQSMWSTNDKIKAEIERLTCGSLALERALRAQYIAGNISYREFEEMLEKELKK